MHGAFELMEVRGGSPVNRQRRLCCALQGALSTGDAGKGTQGEKGGRESESRKTAAAAPEEPRAAEGAERAAAEDVAREPSQATVSCGLLVMQPRPVLL